MVTATDLPLPPLRLEMPMHLGTVMVTSTDLPLPPLKLEMPTHLGTVVATAADLPLPDRSTRPRFTVLPTVGADTTMGSALVRALFSLPLLLLMSSICSPTNLCDFLTALNSPRAFGVRAHALVLCYPSGLKLFYFMRSCTPRLLIYDVSKTRREDTCRSTGGIGVFGRMRMTRIKVR
jgi:hypothetical protein